MVHDRSKGDHRSPWQLNELENSAEKYLYRIPIRKTKGVSEVTMFRGRLIAKLIELTFDDELETVTG